jgi:hypothetical protein
MAKKKIPVSMIDSPLQAAYIARMSEALSTAQSISSGFQAHLP